MTKMSKSGVFNELEKDKEKPELGEEAKSVDSVSELDSLLDDTDDEDLFGDDDDDLTGGLEELDVEMVEEVVRPIGSVVDHMLVFDLEELDSLDDIPVLEGIGDTTRDYSESVALARDLRLTINSASANEILDKSKKRKRGAVRYIDTEDNADNFYLPYIIGYKLAIKDDPTPEVLYSRLVSKFTMIKTETGIETLIEDEDDLLGIKRRKNEERTKLEEAKVLHKYKLKRDAEKSQAKRDSINVLAKEDTDVIGDVDLVASMRTLIVSNYFGKVIKTKNHVTCQCGHEQEVADYGKLHYKELIVPLYVCESCGRNLILDIEAQYALLTYIRETRREHITQQDMIDETVMHEQLVEYPKLVIEEDTADSMDANSAKEYKRARDRYVARVKMANEGVRLQDANKRIAAIVSLLEDSAEIDRDYVEDCILGTIYNSNLFRTLNSSDVYKSRGLRALCDRLDEFQACTSTSELPYTLMTHTAENSYFIDLLRHGYGIVVKKPEQLFSRVDPLGTEAPLLTIDTQKLMALSDNFIDHSEVTTLGREDLATKFTNIVLTKTLFQSQRYSLSAIKKFLPNYKEVVVDCYKYVLSNLASELAGALVGTLYTKFKKDIINIVLGKNLSSMQIVYDPVIYERILRELDPVVRSLETDLQQDMFYKTNHVTWLVDYFGKKDMELTRTERAYARDIMQNIVLMRTEKTYRDYFIASYISRLCGAHPNGKDRELPGIDIDNDSLAAFSLESKKSAELVETMPSMLKEHEYIYDCVDFISSVEPVNSKDLLTAMNEGLTIFSESGETSTTIDSAKDYIEEARVSNSIVKDLNAGYYLSSEVVRSYLLRIFPGFSDELELRELDGYWYFGENEIKDLADLEVLLVVLGPGYRELEDLYERMKRDAGRA